MLALPTSLFEAENGTPVCRAASVLLGGGKPMISCGCRDRWSYSANLCFADETRSRAPDGVGLCGAHAGQHERRLKSLSYPTPKCPHLVMTTTTSDNSRSDSVRLGRIPEKLLSKFYMPRHIKGWD